MKHSNRPRVSKTNNKGSFVKKTFTDLDLVKSFMAYPSFGALLSKSELYAEGFNEGEGESHKLLGISSNIIDQVELFERREKEAKSLTNRRAMVQAYFELNADLLPKGEDEVVWDYKNKEHIEILALYIESMKEDEYQSTGKGYTRNEGVTAILQGYSEKSGRWYTLTRSFNDKKKLVFSYDVDVLCNTKQGNVTGLRNTTLRQARFDIATKSTTYINNSTSVIAADMMKMGYILDGKTFRVVLISNAFNHWIGEVDSYKMVKKTIPTTVVMEDGTEVDCNLSMNNDEWVREDGIWDMAEEVASGVLVLPATTDTLSAVMELKQMESDIQIGASGLSSNAGQSLADQEEHFAMLADIDAMAKAQARAMVRINAKAIKADNILTDNADATSIIEAIYHIAKTQGIADATSVLEQYKSQALDLWKVLFPYSKQTGEILPSSLYQTLKGYVAEARLNAKQDAFIEKCTDQAIGIILRINAGERFDITPAEALEVFEAACAGQRITDKEMFKAIKLAAIAHREGIVA